MRIKTKPKHCSEISKNSELSTQAAERPDVAVFEDDERLLRVDEVAKLLGLSQGCIYHRVSAMQIGGVVRLSSRCLRFQRRALLDWIEGLRQKAE